MIAHKISRRVRGAIVDGVLAGLFGAIAVGASLKLGQRAEPLLSDAVQA